MLAATALPWTPIGARDAQILAVDGLEPRFRARPGDSTELAETLRQASEAGLAVAPRGGGTQTALGNPPSKLDLVLETVGLDRVVEYEPTDLTVTVEAGMRLANLQQLLAAENQWLPLDPPLGPDATIGGIIATNAYGPLRCGYGTARDLVLGTRVANPDGTLTRSGGRVVKNVAGYDLNKLYVGSLGTLGVVVELSFKVYPIPVHQQTVAVSFGNLASAESFLAAVRRSPLAPMALEMLTASAAKQMDLPGPLAVVVRVGGYERAVARQVRDLEALATQHGGCPESATIPQTQTLATAENSDTTHPHVPTPEVPHAFNPPLPLGEGRGEGVSAPAGRTPLNPNHTKTSPEVLVRASGPIATLGALANLLQDGLAAFEPIIWGHAGNGIVYASVADSSPGSIATEPETDFAHLREALLECRRQVRLLDPSASLVVEHCPAPLKVGLDIWGDPGDGIGLMRALKQRLDPRATLNPGRFVGGI